jgi:hypothetical protein
LPDVLFSQPFLLLPSSFCLIETLNELMWFVPFYKSIVNIINTHLHFCVSQLKPVKKILRREALF